MILVKKTSDLIKTLEIQRKKGNTIGFIPTMGALHAGHISLMNASKEKNSVTVCSIFINPMQFNNPKDLEKYPVTIEKDIDQLEEAGCNVLFLPAVEEMYPNGLKDKKKYDLGYLESVLEGEFRPGHFQGVCMIMERLLELVKPNDLYLGQKDYQQCLVIKKLIEIMNLTDSIQVNICSTQRENEGLAMSSRNLLLSTIDRKKASAIYTALMKIKNSLATGDLAKLKANAAMELEKAGFKIEYIAFANTTDLSLVNRWNGKEKLIALVAAFLNNVRLIDNMPLN